MNNEEPPFNQSDEYWMQKALELAKLSAEEGEVPVGAVVVCNGEIIGEGRNRPIGDHDPTAHAEMVALRDAAQKIQNYRLVDTTLYVTLEPCTMCAGAIVHSRVTRVVYGATEPKAGVCESQHNIFETPFFNHKVEITSGVMAEESKAVLQDFFARRRAQKKAEKQARRDAAQQMETESCSGEGS